MLANLKILLYIEALMIIGLLMIHVLAGRAGRRALDGRLMALVLGLPVVGFVMPGGRYAYMAVMVLVLPVLARSRPDAARLYVAALPLMPMLSFSLVLPEPIGFLFMVDTPIMLTWGYLIAFLMHRRVGGQVRYNALDTTAILLWLCMAFITIHLAFGAVTPTHVMRSFVLTSFSTIVPYLLISRSLDRPAHLEAVIQALAITGLLLAVVALFEMVKHWPLYHAVYRNIGVERMYSVRLRGGFLRAPGPFSESTSFGAFMAVAALAVTQMRGMYRSPFHRLGAIGVMMLGLLALSSRAAWLAFPVGLLCVQLYRGRVWRVAFLIGLCVGAYGVVKVVGTANSQMGEFLGVSGHAASTADYREDLLSSGLKQIAQRPLLGGNRPTLSANMADMVQGEGMIDFVNVYLFVGLFAGLVGLALFLSSFAVLAAWLGRMRSRWRRAAYRQSLTFVVAMAGAYAFLLTVQSLADRNPYWLVLLFALGRGLQRAVAYEGRAKRKEVVAEAAPLTGLQDALPA